MNILVIFFYLITILILRINGVEDRELKLPGEDVGETEKQIRLQNSYTLKTIRTHHGDIYDCVNFYNQPAFEHPLLKNLTFIPQNKATSSNEKARNNVFFVIRQNLQLSGRGCPNGTVPIKRGTQEDIIGAKISSQSVSRTNARHMLTHNALCRASSTGYSGARATIITYNPEVNNQQFSAAKMKLRIGPNSIEAGWRVDPNLYKDNKSRFYIRTEAGNTHCFNTVCPGFVITDRSIPLDLPLRSTVLGGPNYGFDISIAKDPTTGHWILRGGTGNTAIGYWPDSLFQNQGLADQIEWGGEVFGVNIRPDMGSGHLLAEDTKKDAFFSSVKVMNGPTSFVDPINVKCESDYFSYKARQEGNVGGSLQFLIFYGGPATED